MNEIWLWLKGSHFGVGAPILEPILVGIGMFTGYGLLTHDHIDSMGIEKGNHTIFCLA